MQFVNCNLTVLAAAKPLPPCLAFHLPESTLIMLVSALAGRDNVLKAYEEAVKEKYRFFSFGDAMFITNE